MNNIQAVIVKENGTVVQETSVKFNTKTQEVAPIIFAPFPKDKEYLVVDDVETCFSMVKPKFKVSKFDGQIAIGKWIEIATPEEIEAAKPEPLPEEETEQSELEELAMELSEMVATQAKEIAELKAGQEETNDAVMELTNLLS